MKRMIYGTIMGLALLAGSTSAALAFETKGTNSQGNCNGAYNSQVTQNGQGAGGVRQQAQTGTRASGVHTDQSLSTCLTQPK